MRKTVVGTLFILAFILTSGPASAAIIEQWASNAIGASSYYPGWTPQDATGAPNVPGYGDNPNAWAPRYAQYSNPGDRFQWLSLGYDTPVYAAGAMVRETYGYGFVSAIEARDENNQWHLVWNGTDPNTGPAPDGTRMLDVFFKWNPTSFIVNALRIVIDTEASASYEEIDAVKLFGSTTPTPIPGAVWLLGSGLVGLVGLRRKRKA